MMTIFVFSNWTTFLDCAPLGEDSQDAPPYTNMGEPLLRHVFTWPLSYDDHHDAILHEHTMRPYDPSWYITSLVC